MPALGAPRPLRLSVCCRRRESYNACAGTRVDPRGFQSLRRGYTLHPYAETDQYSVVAAGFSCLLVATMWRVCSQPPFVSPVATSASSPPIDPSVFLADTRLSGTETCTSCECGLRTWRHGSWRAPPPRAAGGIGRRRWRGNYQHATRPSAFRVTRDPSAGRPPRSRPSATHPRSARLGPRSASSQSSASSAAGASSMGGSRHCHAPRQRGVREQSARASAPTVSPANPNPMAFRDAGRRALPTPPGERVRHQGGLLVHHRLRLISVATFRQRRQSVVCVGVLRWRHLLFVLVAKHARTFVSR